MKNDFDIDYLISQMDFESEKLCDVGHGVFLTKGEMEILDRYDIVYHNKEYKEILFLIEDLLDDMDIIDEELDLVSSSIAERDYYLNTKK